MAIVKSVEEVVSDFDTVLAQSCAENEVVEVRRNGRAIATICPCPAPPRVSGVDKGSVLIPDDCDEPVSVVQTEGGADHTNSRKAGWLKGQISYDDDWTLSESELSDWYGSVLIPR